jgi:hypothetical protein
VSSTPSLMRKALRLAPIALFLLGPGAHAEPHGGGFAHAPHAPVMERPEFHGPEGHEFHGPEGHEFHEPDRHEFHEFDDRFHHDRFYPAIGFGIPMLPDGYTGIGFGAGQFFYQGGVWYQPSGAGYVVVQPPVGIVAPALPPGYTTVNVAGTPYYYANGIYYVATPGGYAVAQPPADPAALASAAVPPAPGTWSYCESAKRYYPYVSQCPEGWRVVPATPPNITQP